MKININGIELDIDVVELTPELAEEFLSSNYPRQRKISQSSIDKYAADMANDRWCWFAFDPIAFSDTGFMMNGQTRCRAVIESGETYPFMVVRGVPEEAFDFIDGGSSRKAWQFLDMPQAKKVQALAKSVLAVYRGLSLTSAMKGAPSITRIEIIEFAREHQGDFLEAVRRADVLRHSIGMGSTLAYSMSAYIAEKLYGDAEVIVRDVVNDSTPLSVSYKQAVMRGFMQSEKPSPIWVLGMTLQYVSAFSQGKNLAMWNKREQAIDKYSKLLYEALCDA